MDKKYSDNCFFTQPPEGGIECADMPYYAPNRKIEGVCTQEAYMCRYCILKYYENKYGKEYMKELSCNKCKYRLKCITKG